MNEDEKLKEDAIKALVVWLRVFAIIGLGIFLSYLMVRCSKPEETTPTGMIDPNLVIDPYEADPIYGLTSPNVLPSYWTAFKQTAESYGVNLDHIENVNFISGDINGSTAALALGSCHPDVLVKVDETIFRNLTRGEQIFLMYHEFGHDVFDLSHESGGLMSPHIRSIEYTLFEREVSDMFNKIDWIPWTEEQCNQIRGL
ncbi:MAG: hypothetical protein MPJ25_14515 [Pirellulales bacterium]|nr:hypothetical protein [Pirellulales bacterium]